MLGKLMRYEWKSTYKIPSAVNLVLALATLLGCLILGMPAASDKDTSFRLFTSVVFYSLSLSAFSMVTYIYVYIRFYKNLFSAEGYLMHTLPVTPLQLFHSKLLVGYFWLALHTVLELAALIALGWASGLFHQVNTRTEWKALLQSTLGASPWEFLPPFFGTMLTGCLTSLLIGYVSILLWQLMEKYKLGASVGFFIAIYLVSQVATSLSVFLPSTMTALSGSPGAYGDFTLYYYRNLLYWSIIAQLILGILLYIACLLLVRRRVNLD